MEAINSYWTDFVKWHKEKFYKETFFIPQVKDYLEFPIYWDRSRPLVEHLYYVYLAYLDRLKLYQTDNNINTSIESIEETCKELLDLINKNISCVDIDWEKYNYVKKAITKFKVEDLRSTDILYKMRKEKNLKKETDFYHIPFDLIKKCSSGRFSAMGCPCLYLGYTEDVAKLEINSEEGSIATFSPKENSPISVLDLTQKNICESNDMFVLWPILAACYVATPRELENVAFKEEYIFPQMLMRYIMNKVQTKDNKKIKGIRYYSCRNINLDPCSTDYMNIALFAKRKENKDKKENSTLKIYDFSSKYDETILTNIFTIGTPYNV